MGCMNQYDLFCDITDPNDIEEESVSTTKSSGSRGITEWVLLLAIYLEYKEFSFYKFQSTRPLPGVALCNTVWCQGSVYGEKPKHLFDTAICDPFLGCSDREWKGSFLIT